MACNVRQVSLVACLLLVLLRVSIGWQFLYEGIWKLNTQKTARPWTAEGYLANARGPLRDRFRALVDDPDGLKKLDFDTMVGRWKDWQDRFFKQYPNLSDDQKKKFDLLLNGEQEFVQPLAELPPGVDLKSFKPKKFKAPEGWYLRYNGKAKRLETNLHLIPEEREALLKLVEPVPQTEDEIAAAADPRTLAPELSPVAKKYQQAINKLADRSGKLGLIDRLQVLLKEDPARVGVVLDQKTGEMDPQRPGDNAVYRHMLARYEENLSKSRQTFQQEHLANQWGKVMEHKAKLLGPVDALTTELKEESYKLLNVDDQVPRGPVPEPDSQIKQINQTTMWGLTILGGLLMLGLFSRPAALGAAGLLLLFYLPMPPWPGVPEAPGPEHSLFVNKNLIEVFACLALAALPTGRWIGLDALVRRLLLGRKTD